MIPDDVVRQVRERAARGERAAAIGRELGISDRTITGWVRGFNRRAAGGPILSLAAEQALYRVKRAAARALRATGFPIATISKALGVPASTIHVWTKGNDR